MVAPRWNHVFSRVQAPQGGYLTWWSRAGTTCFHVSRPDRGVSNMVVLRWNRVFSRVHAIQGVRNMVVLCWNHVFSRVHATQGGI